MKYLRQQLKRKATASQRTYLKMFLCLNALCGVIMIVGRNCEWFFILSLIPTIIVLVSVGLRCLKVNQFLRTTELREPLPQYKREDNTFFFENSLISWYRGWGLDAKYSEILNCDLYEFEENSRWRYDVRNHGWRILIHLQQSYTAINLAKKKDCETVLCFLHRQNPTIEFRCELPEQSISLTELPEFE